MIRPTNDYVVIKRAETSRVTEAGVILVTRQKEPLSEGRILAVGPGKFSRKLGGPVPLTVRVDQDVLFEPHAGTDVAIDGEKFLLLRETEIVALNHRGARVVEAKCSE